MKDAQLSEFLRRGIRTHLAPISTNPTSDTQTPIALTTNTLQLSVFIGKLNYAKHKLLIVENMTTGIRLNKELWDFPGGPVAKTPCPLCRGQGLIPGQGTRSHMLKLRAHKPQLKIPCATTKTLCSQRKRDNFWSSEGQRISPGLRLTTCCALRKVASSSISFQGSETELGRGM